MNATTTPKGCTNFRLRSVSRVISRHYDAHLSASGLKVTQYSTLSHLVRLSPIRPVDLARKMGLDASTLTRNLKPLVLAGLVEQGEGTDARSRQITITEAGRSKHSQAHAMWKNAQRSLNELLGVDRVLALHALLDDTMDVLNTAGLTDESTD